MADPVKTLITLQERGAHASILQVVNVPVVSWFKCKEVYGEDVITLRMLCAGLTEGGKDACQVGGL